MFVHDVLQDATPFILAAMGGLVAERAGIINIGLEGIMLVGALAAMLLAHYTHSPLAGVAGAVLIGMMFVSIMGVFHLHFGADMILAGFALNLLATGGTVYVLWLITGETGNALSLESYPLRDITLPVIDGIPVLKGLSQQSPIVYLALLSLPFTVWLLYRTRSGIHMRAVGESEDAVIEAGLNPRALRWRALLFSGGFCALAGAQLSMSTTTTFVRDMTAGRGFIALGAVYLGAKHPVGTFIAALIFGVFEALAITLQIHTQVPTDLVLMLPYVATVAALVVDGLRRHRARNALTAASA